MEGIGPLCKDRSRRSRGPPPTSAACLSRPTDARAIDAVATGFEGAFLTVLLKEMRQTLEPGVMFGNDNGDVLGGLFDFFLSQHVAKGGGLGIGALVKQQLMSSLGKTG